MTEKPFTWANMLVYSTGKKLHNCSDRAVGADMRRELAERVGENWYAYVPFSDGRIVAAPAFGLVKQPSREMNEFCLQLCMFLNEHVASHGHWVVAFNNARVPIYMLWRDRDGDIHVPFETGQPDLGACIDFGIDNYANQCASAVMIWAERMSRIELADWQKISRALGQRAAAN